MATRGRKPLNDPDGNVFKLEDLDVNIKATNIETDMYGNITSWEGTGTYDNIITGREENLPKGKRRPDFAIIFEHNGVNKELRIDVTNHLTRLIKRQAAKK